MVTKRFICLANSRKLNGRCVAGIELVDGKAAGWLRPVSNHGHGEVSEADRRYKDGIDPALRDIIEAEFTEAKPHDHQYENWLIDDNFYWQKKGRWKRSELANLVTNPGALWGHGQSTYNGCNDRLTPNEAEAAKESLKLIYVNKLKLKVFQPGLTFGDTKRRVQGRFQWGGRAYWLWVTDPIIEKTYLKKQDGEYEMGPNYLTISIGEPVNGWCYKLIAGVIEDKA